MNSTKISRGGLLALAGAILLAIVLSLPTWHASYAETAPAAAPAATAAPAAPPACDGTAKPPVLENCTPNSGDTAWMLTSMAIVLMMTIPGLALFYGGMVRKKNVGDTVMTSFAITCLIKAILHDRRVLKKDRAPVLGVAIKAQFLVGKPLDEMVRGSPVRVVATGAVHFPLAQGMMRKLHLGAHLLFMTGGAGILYGQTGQLMPGHCSRSRMDRVALGASDAVGVMRAATPEKPLPLLMALETDLVLHCSRGWRPLRESNLTGMGFAA